jgi:hypothetical protein
MAVIPEEYLASDFGFTAIDEVEYAAQQTVTSTPSIDENDMMRVVLNALVPIEEKLDRLMAVKVVEESEELSAAIAASSETVTSKLTEVEKLIMPLLVNLLKTADKEYIYWPDRQVKVQSVIDQLLSLTRG